MSSPSRRSSTRQSEPPQGPAPVPHHTLARGLTTRHVQFIALGSAIGTGLFYGSADAIRMAGPAVLLGYVAAGLAVFLVMRALGEMAVRDPGAGSFGRYARTYLGPLGGFVTGWMFVIEMLVVAVADVTALTIYLGHWWPEVPGWVWVVGAIALYWIGAALGRRRLRVIVERMPLVDLHDLDRTEAWFDKHGKATVFFGRMVPIFRSLISIPAGVERMSFLVFLLLSAAGSLIWNTIFVLAGYYLGENWHIAEQYAGIFSRVVLVAVAAFLVWWVVKRVRRNRRGLSDAARREHGDS